MNKTININLGGVFFHIDEIAYQKLKGYLDAIRRSLSDDPQGRDEIITDIETRIGELLSDKVKDVRQVINEADIDEVIEVMGKPEDYMVDDEIFSDQGYGGYKKGRTKKLYRDGSDKFLGGVSSGIAHYLNVDVIWIRLAWLVAAFGFGFGFIVYPLLYRPLAGKSRDTGRAWAAACRPATRPERRAAIAPAMPVVSPAAKSPGTLVAPVSGRDRQAQPPALSSKP